MVEDDPIKPDRITSFFYFFPEVEIFSNELVPLDSLLDHTQGASRYRTVSK